MIMFWSYLVTFAFLYSQQNGNKMSFKNKIAESDSIFFLPVKIVFYQLYNKYYKVNEIIKKSYIDKDSYIVVELTNGIKLTSPPSKYPADINFTERYKYGFKSKMDKILDVNKYFFMYEILSELFINSNYFKHHGLNSGETVVDAGANIGGFVVQAAQKVGSTGKIYAIEPDKENLITLRKNLELNNIKNCEIIEVGLWSEKKTMEFFISHRPGEHTLINYEGNPHFVKKEVQTLKCEKFDDIVKEYNISKVDYFKMDIEGAEIEALKGAKDFLTNNNPFLFIEAAHEVDGQPAYHKVIHYLSKFGYKLLSEVEQARGTVFAKK